MKKVSNVVFALLFLIILGASSAEARKGGSGSHRGEHFVAEQVFQISPEQFQKILSQFKERNPDYLCGDWSYISDAQLYTVTCVKKGDSLDNDEELELSMAKNVHLYVYKKRRN